MFAAFGLLLLLCCYECVNLRCCCLCCNIVGVCVVVLFRYFVSVFMFWLLFLFNALIRFLSVREFVCICVMSCVLPCDVYVCAVYMCFLMCNCSCLAP